MYTYILLYVILIKKNAFIKLSIVERECSKWLKGQKGQGGGHLKEPRKLMEYNLLTSIKKQ